jgi:hypothetical protein
VLRNRQQKHTAVRYGVLKNDKSMKITHHYLIIQSEINKFFGDDKHDDLQSFLLELVKKIEMECLIEPQIKFSHQKAWTGIIGIVTSHIISLLDW